MNLLKFNIKTSNFLFIAVICSSLSCKSQIQQQSHYSWSSRTVKSKDFTYIVEVTTKPDIIFYRNIKDTLDNSKIKYDGDAIIELNKNHEIDTIVKKVLYKKLSANYSNDKKMVVGLLISKDATIKFLDFRINNSLNNLINIIDIEQIEKDIRKTINPKIIQFRSDADYSYYAYIVRLNNLVPPSR